MQHFRLSFIVTAICLAAAIYWGGPVGAGTERSGDPWRAQRLRADRLPIEGRIERALDLGEHRRAARAHIGHHLSFLLDDPNLVPPSTQLSLAMPQP